MDEVTKIVPWSMTVQPLGMQWFKERCRNCMWGLLRPVRQRREITPLRRFSLARETFFLLRMNLNLLVLDIEAEMVVNAHVLIGHPYEREQRDQVSAPVVEEKFEAGENQKRRRDIMAETVFTGE